jgi:hypothetical protein
MNGISKTQYDALVCHISAWGTLICSLSVDIESFALRLGIESFALVAFLKTCVVLLILRAWWLERKMEGDRK